MCPFFLQKDQDELFWNANRYKGKIFYKGLDNLGTVLNAVLAETQLSLLSGSEGKIKGITC